MDLIKPYVLIKRRKKFKIIIFSVSFLFRIIQIITNKILKISDMKNGIR